MRDEIVIQKDMHAIFMTFGGGVYPVTENNRLELFPKLRVEPILIFTPP